MSGLSAEPRGTEKRRTESRTFGDGGISEPESETFGNGGFSEPETKFRGRRLEGLSGIYPRGELEGSDSWLVVVAVFLGTCNKSFPVDFANRYDGVLWYAPHTDGVFAVHAADARLLFLCFL